MIMGSDLLCSGCRCMKRRKAAREAAPMKPTPKAMTPSAAYPYFGEKPMQFRGVKVRASPKVRDPSATPRTAL